MAKEKYFTFSLCILPLRCETNFAATYGRIHRKTPFLLDIAQIIPISPARKLGKFVNFRKRSKSKHVEINLSSPPPTLYANLRNFFFLFLQKCQNQFGQGVLPIWEMPKRKSFFCLGSHPLVNGPISWGSTQTSYTCHGHRPCLGDIPFYKAPSFYQW